MSGRIESLTLNKFRGSTSSLNITFDTTKSLVMIFGENGSGKSTIIDGIDFISNRSFGSLEDRSVPTGKGRLLTSLGADADELEVKLRFNGSSWTGKMSSKNKTTISGPENCPKVHILRRSHLSQIIDSTPKDRYEAIKKYIEVPFCEKNEKALRDAIKKNTKEYDFSFNVLTQSRAELEKLWDDENNPGNNCWEWAGNKITVDAAKLKEDIDCINIFLANYMQSASKYNEFKNLERQQQIEEKRRDQAKETFLKNQLKTVKSPDILIEILKQSQSYFEQNRRIGICPVCMNEIHASEVNRKVKERLATMAHSVHLKDEYEEIKNKVDNNQNLLKSTQTQFIRIVKEMIVHFHEKNLVRLVQPIVNASNPFTYRFQDQDKDIDNLTFTESFSLCTGIKPYKIELEKKKEELNKTFHQFNAIRNHIKRIKENEKLCKKLEKKIERLKKLLKIIEKERKTFVESILEDISETVEDIYLKVHPDEGMGKIKFFLKPNTIGSLEFSGKFLERDDIIPQAYFSESHLDTLGICVFLALARHYKDENTIVVMDDVLTSVDQVHTERFSKILAEEAAHFNQVIITSHSRIWRDKYKSSENSGFDIQLIELQPWSISGGISLTK